MRFRATWAAVLGIAVAFGLGVAGCGSPPATGLAGYVLAPEPDVRDLELPDVTAGGADYPFVAKEGGLLVTFFGYTSCPDVCPLTMSDLGHALGALGERAAAVQVAMVTVDPQRDTPDVLGGYVTAFIAGAHGLRTTDQRRLRSVADRFGVSFDVEHSDGGVTTVSHTASLFVVDDEGRVVLVWPFGIGSGEMAADLQTLLASRRA